MPAVMEIESSTIVAKNKQVLSFRLTEVGTKCLDELVERLGITKTAVIEQALREFYTVRTGKEPTEYLAKKRRPQS